jgi:hypothetical protein
LVPTEAARSCLQCPDRKPVAVTGSEPVREIVPGIVDPIQTPEMQPVPHGWAIRTEVRREHVAALRHLIDQAYTPLLKWEQPEGVLIVGGGRYGPMAALSCHMLRRVGSRLPVQVWHRGAQEPFDPAWVAGLKDVEIVDATQVVARLDPKHQPRILRGWEHKTFAMLYCGFERLLYLDADAYCVRDPSPLFDLLAEDPFVYWIDLPNTAENVNAHAFGLEPQAVAEVPMVQGGQLLIDMAGLSREFVLAHWLNQHSDYSYYDGGHGGRKHAFGDQDQWRVALAATSGTYRTLGFARCVGGIFECRWQGVPWVVHRCQAKFWPDQPLPARRGHLPLENEVFTIWDEIVNRG